MKIICPTDFMPHTKSALSLATSIANHLNAELHIITIIDLSTFVENNKQLREESQKEKVRQISNLIEKFQLIIKGKPPTLVARCGNPKSAILEYADEIEANLIVMGTQGNTTLTNKFLGSVANAVVKGSKVPIFVIPEEYSFDRYPSKMLMALDNKILENECSFDLPITLAKIWKSKIDIIHVMQKEENDFPFDPFATTFLKEHLGDIHLPKEKDIAFGLMKFVIDRNFDVLIMVKREEGFLKKLFKKDHIKEELMRTSIPILIIQE